MNEYIFNLTLSVSHPLHDPLGWIEQMPFSPMVHWKIGESEITNVKKGVFSRQIVNKNNYCCFEVETMSSSLLPESLLEFVSKVQDKREFFQNIVNTGGSISLSVGWYVDGNATEEMSWELMEQLFSLKINLLFDVYSDYESEERPRK